MKRYKRKDLLTEDPDGEWCKYVEVMDCHLNQQADYVRAQGATNNLDNQYLLVRAALPSSDRLKDETIENFVKALEGHYSAICCEAAKRIRELQTTIKCQATGINNRQEKLWDSNRKLAKVRAKLEEATNAAM